MTNASTKGTIKASRAVITLFERFDEAVISSRLERSMTRRTATKAPPMPKVIPVVMATALVAAAVVDAVEIAASSGIPLLR